MHVSPTGEDKLSTLKTVGDECAELIPALELVGDQTEQEFYRKQLRIKSFKAYEWLENEKTVYNLASCVLATRMLERVMHQFMRWQSEETWITLEAPLIRMANMTTSPAAQAVLELGRMMQDGMVSALTTGNVTLDDLTTGDHH